MRYRISLGAAALLRPCASRPWSPGMDDSKYPDLSGQWRRSAARTIRHEQACGEGSRRRCPEYQAIFEANLKDQAKADRARPRPTHALARHAARHQRYGGSNSS